MGFLEHAKIDFRFVFALVALMVIASSVSAENSQQASAGIAPIYVIANYTNGSAGMIAMQPYVYLGDLSLKSDFAQGEPIYMSATLANQMGYQQDVVVTLRISGNQIMYDSNGRAYPTATASGGESDTSQGRQAKADDGTYKSDSGQAQITWQGGDSSQEGSVAIPVDSRTYYVSQGYTLGAYEKRTVEFKVSQDNLPYSDTIGVMCAAGTSKSDTAQESNSDTYSETSVAIYANGTIGNPIGCNREYKAYTVRLMAAPGTQDVYAPGNRGAAVSGSFTVTVDNGSQASTAVEQALYPGWNLVSAPTQPYGSIDYNDCQVASPFWSYNPQTNQYEKDGNPIYHTGYWIYSSNKCTLKYVVPFGIVGMPNPNSPKHMYAGWNLVGNPFMFLSANPSISQMTGCTITSGPWAYDTLSQQYVKADSLSNGKGVWIKVDSECDMYYKGDNTPPAPPQ